MKHIDGDASSATSRSTVELPRGSGATQVDGSTRFRPALKGLADVPALIAALPEHMWPQAAPGTWEMALARLPREGRILCAGAGRGGLSTILVALGYEVVSVDLHPDHFVAAGLQCQFADFLLPLPFVDGYFDAVLAVEVIEHLENPWFFLREAIRVVHQDGVLVVTSPNVESIASRTCFARSGQLPFFKKESFFGCYHVTPIFGWAIERWCTTTTASLSSINYNRANWLKPDDMLHWDRGIVRRLKQLLPINKMTGEIACYTITKTGTKRFNVGHHYG